METPVQPGDVLADKYRVERVLGQGGMGLVVAARHLELGELFAVKFLLPEAIANAEAMERFHREARASARLKGQHVVKVHDVGRLSTGAPYIVMEYLEGSDLKTVLRERGPLPAVEAALILLQACEAITEAHAIGIVHRDIKPANLFLAELPVGGPCVKVLDFGISKQTAPDSGDITKTGAALGSPAYMSPEQMLSSRSADARSDIWSLGAVLYELVTGVSPFAAEVVTEVIARVLKNEPVPPSRLRPELPEWVDAIVMRCLKKEPGERFSSVEELTEALRQSAELPPSTRRSLSSSRVSGAPRSSTAGSKSATASVTNVTWGRSALPSQAQRGPGRAGALVAAGLTVVAIVGALWFAKRSEGAAAAPQPPTVDGVEARQVAVTTPAPGVAANPSASTSEAPQAPQAPEASAAPPSTAEVAPASSGSAKATAKASPKGSTVAAGTTPEKAPAGVSAQPATAPRPSGAPQATSAPIAPKPPKKHEGIY
jgi:serine/threonine protein kinase